MVVESWESVQANQNVPLQYEALFRALANSMHKTVHRGAHGYLQIMGPEREECRRVALSFGLCLES